jgi:hypothetical protein
MTQGNDFANYAASVEDKSSSSDDVWHVAVASDDIKQMSVDQLDEAFRLGVISSETPVWTEGMDAWAPLGEVADLDGDGDGDADVDDGPTQAFGAMAPQSGVMPHRSFAAGPSSVAPVTSSFAPAAGQAALLMQSTGPVALNVDEDMPPIRVGRRFKPERWLLAAAGIAAIGVTAYNNSELFSASAASPVAAVDAQAAGSKALAARPYEAGGGVDRGSPIGAANADAEDESAAAKSGESAGDKPMGDSPAAKEVAKAEPAPAATKAALSPAKESLQGSFSKAFTKKAPPAKPAKAVKTRKAASRAATAPRKAKKASSAPRAGSAFDPLNDSLP